MNDFTHILQQLSDSKDLTPGQAGYALQEIVDGRVNGSRIAAFLYGMSCKGETIEELTAFVHVMREAAVKVEVDLEHAIDLCGTGGDKSGSFNISTATMFVVAGAGVPVLKHGNAGVSSRSGSYDVLKSLGVRPELKKDQVEACFRNTNTAFMFAPLFHPAMAHVMPARKELGIRTFFNIMGPMLNPAGVKRQIVGAFNRETARKIINILANTGSDFAYTVHADDGLDEFSNTAATHVYQLTNGTVQPEMLFDAGVFGISTATKEQLQGGEPDENAAIIRRILDDNATDAQREVVILNATFGIHASGMYTDLQEAYYEAQESLETGKARYVLKQFVEATSDLAATS